MVITLRKFASRRPCHGDQGGRSDGDRVGAQRRRLGQVGATADVAGDDQLDLPVRTPSSRSARTALMAGMDERRERS